MSATVIVNSHSDRVMGMAPPARFMAEVPYALEHLNRDWIYDWLPVKGDGSEIPLESPCIVRCVVKHLSQDCRCLAFARRDRREIGWFGVTAPWQEPVELYGVVGYSPFQ